MQPFLDGRSNTTIRPRCAHRYLLDKGADVNWANRNGMSALHLAAVCGDRDMARELVDRGAAVEARTHSVNRLYTHMLT